MRLKKNSHFLIAFSIAFINTAFADVVITADTLRHDQKLKKSFAEGNAKVIDGEGTEQKILTADTIEADHNSDQKENDSIDLGGGAISRVIAKGNVKMIAQDRTVTAGTCEYVSKTQMLTCHGNVEIVTPKEHLKGDKALADLKAQVYKLEKSAKQTNAVVQSER